MVGRVIGLFFKVVGFGLAFWLLAYLIISIFTDFLHDYNFLHTENQPAIVTEKISENSLTGKPKYFVVVNLNEDDRFNEIKNRVFAWQFKRLEVGDTVKGHYIRGEHFFTTLDIVTDSFVFLFIMILLLLFLVALILWPVIVISERREKQKWQQMSYSEKKKQKKAQHKKNKKTGQKKKNSLLKNILPKKVYHRLKDLYWGEVVLYVFLVVALLFTSSFVINGVQKLAPIGKTATKALVIDSDAESEIYYYIGEVSDPYYSLELVFPDENGEMRKVIKEVTRSVYRKHGVGDSIEISYVNWNPYNIFVRDYSLLNIWETVTYVKYLFYVSILFGLFIFIGLYYFSRKDKKSG